MQRKIEGRSSGQVPQVAMGYVPWDDEQRPSSIGLWDILEVLRRRMWLVLGIAAGAIPVALYLAYTTVPMNKAVAVIRLGDARRAMTGGLVEGQGTGLSSRTIDPLRSELEVISSRSTLGAVVDSTPALRIVSNQVPFRLFDAVAFSDDALRDTLTVRFQAAGFSVQGQFGGARAPYGTPVQAGGVQFAIRRQPGADNATVILLERDEAIDRILNQLRVRPRELTNVVDISFIDRDSDRARWVVNRVVEVFQRVNADNVQDQARRQRVFIETQLTVSDSLLADARRALSQFRAQQAGYEANGAAAPGAMMQLRVRRDELAVERRSLQNLLDRLQEAADSTRRDVLRAALATPRLANNVEATQRYRQLVEYETALDSLASVSAASNPDVRRVKELIVATEGRLVMGLEAAIRTLVATMDAEIGTLDGFRARNEATALRSTTSEAEEARLMGAVDNARRMTDELRQAYQRAQLAEAVEVGQVEIVDRAVAAEPVGLGALPKVMVVLLLGLVVGAGGAFVFDRSDRAIHNMKQLETLGLPVLGSVPRLKHERNGIGSEGASGPVVEALRGIRLNMVYAHGTAGSLVTAITSPQEGDGKSFVASNLALAFAHAGHSTLLIDGDVRRGVLHRVLGAQRKPGLTDFLLGEANCDQILQETQYPGLHFIGCGTRTPEAPERLGSSDMTQLVTTLRGRFGVVLIDSPPLGAGVDALCLATATGNLLLVVRGGRTNRELAEAKLDLVERLPVRMLGAVINAASMDSSDRYYSYYMDGYELTSEEPSEQLVDQEGVRKLQPGEYEGA